MKSEESNQESVFDLPAPSPEESGQMPLDTPEAAGNEPAGELPGRAELPQAAPALPPTLPVPADPAVTAAVPDDKPVSGAPAAAGDADLIEKEWVDKAKAIVEQTREDPRKQIQELSKVKADYIKKRFNKDIPVVE